MLHLTLDFGGTNIKLGLVSNGKVLALDSIAAVSGAGLLPRLSAVEEASSKLLQSIGHSKDDLTGLGIAMPGLIDPVANRVLSINAKYNDAVGFDFDQWAMSRFGLPMVMDNDAKSALMGEVAYGSARGETDAVLMIFGTGIGTAAIMDGKLLRGRHHQAGNLGGHMATDIYGAPCNCGNYGCVEAQSAHWALPERAASMAGFSGSLLARQGQVDYKAVVEAAGQGDRIASLLLDDLILHWSAGIINLIHAYDPEMVILSGGLMKSSSILLPRLEEKVHKHAWTPWGKVRFAVAENPDTSVLLGMSRLLLDKGTGH